MKVSKKINDFINELNMKFPNQFYYITNRDYDTQFDLYKKGREVLYNTEISLKGHKYNIVSEKIIDKSSVVTYALPYQSYHCFGGAVDVVPIKEGYNITKDFYIKNGIVEIAKKYGLEWGANWNNLKDIYHFQDNTVVLPSSPCWSTECNYNWNKGLTANTVIYAVILIGALCGLLASFRG